MVVVATHYRDGANGWPCHNAETLVDRGAANQPHPDLRRQ